MRVKKSDPLPKIVDEIRVCDDCMLIHANGECDPERPADLPIPWGLWLGRAHLLAMGGTHAVECKNADECDCLTYEFSTSTCEGCGDTNHGRRHTFTVFDR